MCIPQFQAFVISHRISISGYAPCRQNKDVQSTVSLELVFEHTRLQAHVHVVATELPAADLGLCDDVVDVLVVAPGLLFAGGVRVGASLQRQLQQTVERLTAQPTTRHTLIITCEDEKVQASKCMHTCVHARDPTQRTSGSGSQ